MTGREQGGEEAPTTLSKGITFTAEQEAARLRWAGRFIKRFEGVGQAAGYGIFHGGSLIRDIDIVAVPWRDPMPHDHPDEWVLDLHHVLGGIVLGERGVLADVASDTLHGHRAYRFWMPGHLDHQIDLKVIRPAALTARPEEKR